MSLNIAITQRQVGAETVQTVNARDLHAFLQVQSAFKDWIARRIADYGFQDGRDFCSFLSESQGGRPAKEYAITIDMAKELSMVERNERGKQARQYFIECERRAKAAPQIDPLQMLNDPAAMRGLLLSYTEKVIALQGQVAAMQPTVEAYDRIAKAKEGACSITQAAKDLQMQPSKLFTWLEANRWIYKRSNNSRWTAFQDKIQNGFLEHKVTEVNLRDGDTKIVSDVHVTPKGLARLGLAMGIKLSAVSGGAS